jgi:hypothetical protein
MHTAEPLVPEPDPSPLGVEIAITDLTKYKSSGNDQIPAELIQAEGETLQSEIHKLINSIWRKEKLLHDLYGSPSIIRMTKSRRMRWAGHVAHMEEKRNAYRIWWESQKERDH